MKNDYYYMKRALSLARKGAGKTSPNPMVGAVIVQNGKIIGEGFHRRYRSLHAEVEAIQNSDVSVKGSTLYCTLEPCSFTSPEKNNPPCTSRIISEGVKRVVIAGLDPDSRVNGSGIHILREAGIEVVSGVMEKESKELNAGYIKWNSTGIPFVRLKIAQSLDGRIATGAGNSKWITDETARMRVHKMRSFYDAVLVGSGTVIKDDPSLSVRKIPGRQPVRVVLDGRGRVGGRYKVVNGRQNTIIFTGERDIPSKLQEVFSKNVEIIQVEKLGNELNLKKILTELGKRNIRSVLVEGGSAVFSSFLKSNLWDSVSVFISPLILGKGIEAVGDLGISSLRDAVNFKDGSFKHIGNQILFEGNRVNTEYGEDSDVYWVD